VIIDATDRLKKPVEGFFITICELKIASFNEKKLLWYFLVLRVSWLPRTVKSLLPAA
jgi:hypothetical protein